MVKVGKFQCSHEVPIFTARDAHIYYQNWHPDAYIHVKIGIGSRDATVHGNAPFQCFGCTRPPTHKLDPLHPGVVLATLLPYTSSRKHEFLYAE